VTVPFLRGGAIHGDRLLKPAIAPGTTPILAEAAATAVKERRLLGEVGNAIAKEMAVLCDRLVTEHVDIRGYPVRRGQTIFLLVGGANRDPQSSNTPTSSTQPAPTPASA